MSWYDPVDDVERGGECAECGEPVEQEHHAYCSDCYAEQNGWKRPARPEPGETPRSYIEGLAQVREQLRQLEQAAEGAFADVERRLDALEARLESKRAPRAA